MEQDAVEELFFSRNKVVGQSWLEDGCWIVPEEIFLGFKGDIFQTKIQQHNYSKH